jgi:hypothetical protein
MPNDEIILLVNLFGCFLAEKRLSFKKLTSVGFHAYVMIRYTHGVILVKVDP